MTSAPTPEAPTPVRPVLFGAIIAPVKRRRWPLVTTIVLMCVAGVAVSLHRKAGSTNVITSHGIRTVQRGMTTREVNELLGKPFDVRRQDDGSECFKYGHPTIQMPSFVVYNVCYAEGRLRDVTQLEYTASAVAPDGSPVESPPPGTTARPGEGG